MACELLRGPFNMRSPVPNFLFASIVAVLLAVPISSRAQPPTTEPTSEVEAPPDATGTGPVAPSTGSPVEPAAAAPATPVVEAAEPSADTTAPAAIVETVPPAPAEVVSPLPAVTAASGDIEGGISAADGAYVRTHDRAWSLRIGGLFQLRVDGSSSPDPSREFEFVPVMSRLYLQGALSQPWIRYYFQTEFAGQTNPAASGAVPPAPRILDAWFEAQPHEAFGVRVGMMRPFFTRSWIAGLNRMLMFDRTDANLFFRNHGTVGGGSTFPFMSTDMAGNPITTNVTPNLPVTWDRDIGATIFGTPADGLFEYYAGVFNGNGFLFGRNEAASAMPMVRLAVNPLGRMAYDETIAASNPHAPPRMQIGVAGYYNNYHTSLTLPPSGMLPIPTQTFGQEEQFTFGSDVSMQFEGVYLTGEFYFRHRNILSNGAGGSSSHDEMGGMGMAGWMFWAPYLEVAARFSMIDPNLGRAGDFRQVYDVGLNLYPAGNNVKLELRYTASINDATQSGSVDGASFTIPSGQTVHTVGLWLQMYI